MTDFSKICSCWTSACIYNFFHFNYFSKANRRNFNWALGSKELKYEIRAKFNSFYRFLTRINAVYEQNYLL